MATKKDWLETRHKGREAESRGQQFFDSLVVVLGVAFGCLKRLVAVTGDMERHQVHIKGLLTDKLVELHGLPLAFTNDSPMVLGRGPCL